MPIYLQRSKGHSITDVVRLICITFIIWFKQIVAMQGRTPQTHFFDLFRRNVSLQSSYLFNIEFAWPRKMYSFSPVNMEVTL